MNDNLKVGEIMTFFSLSALESRNSPLLQFVRYGTRRSGDKSGAYLFLPDGPAKPIPVEGPLVRIVEGKIISYIEVVLAFAIHTVTLKSSPGMGTMK